MIEFLQENSSWIFLIVGMLLMIRMHGMGGGHQHDNQAPERDRDGSIITKDPVCDTVVRPETAAATSEYEGKSYYFCSSDCKVVFEKNPEKFTQVAVPRHRMVGGG